MNNRKASNKGRFRKQRLIQVQNRDGKFHIPNMGAWYTYWRDPYHLLLTIPWVGFAVLLTVLYLAINSLFALAYLAGGKCLEGAQPGDFADAFFFSVQTLGSIGYGAVHPITFYANCIVTLEAIISLLLIAVVTGLAFARFSRPQAKVIFSNEAVINQYNGVPTLSFRIANERQNIIIEAQLQVYLLVNETTQEGHFMRRFHELKMMRSRTPALSLTWTPMHVIDTESPLLGHTSESLAQLNAQIQVSITGIDEAVSYNISARHNYASQEILYNQRFVDIFVPQANGDRHIDYRYFHAVVPIETPS